MFSRRIGLLIILLISIATIFFQFNTIPCYLFFDELEFAKLALSLDGSPYIPYSNLATGHSTLYFYILLGFLKTFGVHTVVLRLPAAIFGILSTLLFYEIMKRVLKTPTFVPLLTAILFAASRWYFNFARFSFEATFLLFLELTSIYFFLIFTTRKRLFPLIAAGVFAGLSFHSYYPGRIFFLLPLFFIVLHFRKYIIPFLLTVIIIASPLLIHLKNNPDKRFQEQFYFSNPQYSLEKKFSYLRENISKSILMFNVDGDKNGRHNYPGKPALNPILGLLFIGGLVLALKNIRSFYNSFFILYFTLSLVPSIVSTPYETPNMLRAFTAIPSTMYFIGLALQKLFSIFEKKKLYYGSVLLIMLLIISIAYELRTYYMFQSEVFLHDASKIKNDINYILK